MKEYKVVGIGSALLDFTFNVNENILNKLGLKKGEMQLIDKETSKNIFTILENNIFKISAGGSASNTIAGVSYLGDNSAFIGKIGNDKNGNLYKKITEQEGVAGFFSEQAETTGHAITFITPDFERTFAVHLGASSSLDEKDIPESIIKKSNILHFEGYQLGDIGIRKAVYYAAKIARENNLYISLDLSDAGLVTNNLSIFKNFIKENVNIVFANESEAKAFSNKRETDALNEISEICDIAIVKLGEKGSLIKKQNNTYRIPSYKTNIINTNGAGDMYSAGILHGIANNIDLEKAGKLASYIASLVVSKQEARFGNNLKSIADRFYFCRIL